MEAQEGATHASHSAEECGVAEEGRCGQTVSVLLWCDYLILSPHVSNAVPLPLATRLKGNWKNQVKVIHPQDGPMLGGLTNDHASSVRPEFDMWKLGTVREVNIC